MRLVSLAAQKFLEGVLKDALALAKARGAPGKGAPKRGADGREKDRRFVLSREDVAAALAQRGASPDVRLLFPALRLCAAGISVQRPAYLGP